MKQEYTGDVARNHLPEPELPLVDGVSAGRQEPIKTPNQLWKTELSPVLERSGVETTRVRHQPRLLPVVGRPVLNRRKRIKQKTLAERRRLYYQQKAA